MTTKQMIIGGLIVVGLAIVLGVTIKACSDRGKTVVLTPTEIKRDSVDNWAKDAQKVIDSLVKDAAKRRKAVDSLSWANFQLDHELDVQTLRTSTLLTAIKLGKKYKDTAAQLSACDSLVPQVVGLQETAQNYQNSNHALQNSFDSLLSTNSLEIARLDYNNSVLKESFDKLAANAISLEKSNVKLSKPKRFGLGFGVGYGTNGYRIMPVFSVGLHYSFVQF